MIGTIKTISKSKIKNRIEIIKYWVEKESRLLFIMLNPHSNSFNFWLDLLVVSLMELKIETSNRTKINAKQKLLMSINFLVYLIGN